MHTFQSSKWIKENKFSLQIGEQRTEEEEVSRRILQRQIYTLLHSFSVSRCHLKTVLYENKMDSQENESELLERCRIERLQIVNKYDIGRDEGAKIDDWEDPKYEEYHQRDRFGFYQ